MKRLFPFILIFILSIFLIFITSNLFAKTRGIEVSVKTSKGNTIDLYHDSYALIVGNGNYINGWDPLPGAVKDVKEVSEALKRNGFKVDLKTDLTKEGFNRVFTEFVLKHGKDRNNRLLFYYAGHGHTEKMATGEELGYIVMVDAPLPEKDPVEFSILSVDMQSLVTQAKRIKAKHVLFIFDSCFSGTVLNLRDRVTPNVISDNVKLPVRQFITAGRANESVPDYSVFKQCFLDILEGRDDEPIRDGYLTGEELGLYLKTKVPSYNKNQHPQYGKIKDPKLDKGDFVFVLSSSGVGGVAPVKTDKVDTELDAVRKQLEKERQELERLKIELERTKLEAERKRIEEEKGKLLTKKTKKYASISPEVSKPKVIDRDRHFIKYVTGVVYDKKTGLEWVAGPDRNTTWYEAKSWVENLNVAGGGWRMPTRAELKTLYKKEIGSRNMTPLFKTTGWWIWSYETKGSSSAWYFSFLDSYENWSARDRSDYHRGFSVRSRK